MAFEDNHLLFGHDRETRLLAVELAGPDSVEIFRRGVDGSLERRIEPLRPIIWTAGSVPQPKAEYQSLAGTEALGFLAVCDDWPTFLDLRTAFKNAGLSHHAPGDPSQQYLLQSGKTLFKGLSYEELRRMQIALDVEDEVIRRIHLASNHGWSAVLEDSDERKLLQELTSTIQSQDPDVIEGHDLFRSILHQINGRAKRVRLKLPWGRNESLLAGRASRLQIAEKTIGYTKFTAYGRHFIDTYVLSQFWDVNARELEGYTLEDVASHFHLSGNALDQTRALVDLLGASHFIQAQIFPYVFQDVVLRGNATKIDALLLREYFRAGHSVPDLPVTRSFEGGYTDIFFTGVARNVWHCDVASLYPSVMLHFDCFPAGDKLGIFRGLLSDLRQFRLEAKAKLKQATEPADRHHLNALQAAFKILINSFYGYLGFAQGHFADFDAASRVTQTGRDLLRQMVEWLRQNGAEVIEIDTDGIYFVPPLNVKSIDTLQQGLSASLPQGIDVDFDAQYPAMFSYKAKNYALLTKEGDLVIKGGALRSRGLEKFQRLFLEKMLRHLLEGESQKISTLRAEFESHIRNREWPIEYLAKTDTLQDSLAQYSKKIEASSRNRSAPYELALRSGKRFQPGDQVSYYITGTKRTVAAYEMARLTGEWNAENRDENVEYYVGKLNELARKFEAFAAPQESTGLLL